MTNMKKCSVAALAAAILATALTVPAVAEAPAIRVNSYKGSTLEVGEHSGLIIGPSGTDYTVTSSEPDIAADVGSLYGFGDNLTVFTGTADAAQRAVDNWINSPGHFQTIIDPRCDCIGDGRDPVRRNRLLLHVRWDTQQCQLLCVTKYETKWCVPGSVERTTFLLIGKRTLSNIAYQ